MNRRCLFAVALVGSLHAQSARAQEDPRKAQAEALFHEALKLHDGDREGDALERFEKSYATFPSPNTLYWVAREEHLLKRSLLALRHYREAAKSPLLYAKNLQLARQYIAELEPRFARVTVTGPSGTKVRVGDKDVRLPVDDAIDVEAGTVLVKGDHDGTAYEAKGLAVAGQTVTIELRAVTAKQTTEPSVAPPPQVEPPSSEPTHGWSTPRVVTTAAFGVGAVAGVVLGFVFHGAALAAAEDSRAVLKPVGGCNGSTSPECGRARELESDRDRSVTLSTASFVGGGVLGAAAIATAVLWPTPRTTTGSTRPRITPLVSGTALGADLGFSF